VSETEVSQSFCGPSRARPIAARRNRWTTDHNDGAGRAIRQSGWSTRRDAWAAPEPGHLTRGGRRPPGLHSSWTTIASAAAPGEPGERDRLVQQDQRIVIAGALCPVRTGTVRWSHRAAEPTLGGDGISSSPLAQTTYK
jgi:hypothetical protein